MTDHSTIKSNLDSWYVFRVYDKACPSCLKLKGKLMAYYL